MTVVHQRMAELWLVQKKRELTVEENTEMVHCLQANASYCRKMAELENWSYMASLTGDTNWQHEICMDIEILRQTGTKKKPNTKSAD